MSQFWSIFFATFAEFLSGKTKYILAGMLVVWFLIFFFTTTSEVETDGKLKTFKTGGVRIRLDETASFMKRRFEKGVDFLCTVALLITTQLFAFILVGVSSARNLVSTLSKGSVEFILTQPFPRWKFFVYKYIATLMFFSLTAFLFVTANWLVGTLRLSEISFRFLYAFLYILVLYAPLIALIYLLFGLTANAKATTSVPVAIMVIATLLYPIYQYYDVAKGLYEEKIGWGIRVAVVFYHILPKISE
ncbi:MAG: hypothetical protein N2234_09120, partial [Planctomycetota bacterium]|nr:hypothetical protein [Planctomycetota bacterium]